MYEEGPLIPADLLVGGAPTNPVAAGVIAQRLLPAVQRLADGDESGGLVVRRITTAAEVSSFRIEIANSPYYATITEHNVIEAYHVDMPRRAGRRRTEMRPVLVELMHVFTVHDAEGALVSASDAVPAFAQPEAEASVFGELFEAARHVEIELAGGGYVRTPEEQSQA